MPAVISFLLYGFILTSAIKAEATKTENDILDEAPATCVGEGGKCDCDYLGDSWEFNCTKACAYPYRCYYGECVTTTTKHNCTVDTDCHQALRGTGAVICLNGKCAAQRNAGDICKSTSECYGDMKCEGRHCAGIVTDKTDLNCTPSIPAVDPMIPGSRSGFSCAKGTFCNSSRKCVAKIKAGKNCSVDDGELCEDGCTCNAGFCVKRFSVNDGEKCTDTFACGLESTCKNGVCVKGTERFKYMECSSDNECFTEGINGTCSGINKRTQKRYCEFPSANCRKAYKTLLECMDYNNCAPIITNNYYSCTKDKCTQELSKVLGCESNCDFFKDMYGNCVAKSFIGYCPKVPTWKKILITFSIILGIVVLVFIIFIISKYIKKDRTYSKI